MVVDAAELETQRDQYERILSNVKRAYPPEKRDEAIEPIKKALDELNSLLRTKHASRT